MHELDLAHFLNRDNEKQGFKLSQTSDDTEAIDGLASLAALNSNKQTGANSAMQLPSNTTNSSRKSSISEYTTFGTSPAANTMSLLGPNSRNLGKNSEREASFNLPNDDQDTASMQFLSGAGRNSININVHGVLKSSSASLAAHEFLKKHPKCFGAKFSGLPGFLNKIEIKIN